MAYTPIAHTTQPEATLPRCSFACALSSPAQLTSWPATPVAHRLRVLRRARNILATRSAEVAAAISPNLARSTADTLITELLPLLDAIRFLEHNAKKLLTPRRLGRSGRPFWLAGVAAELHREPLGHILIIGPANFPLFLPGVQSVQALAAGNTVTWKPGTGGAPVAELFARVLAEAGLPAGTLTITADTLEASQQALTPPPGISPPDKVIFTGSSAAGSTILATLAQTATPAVMELSGADAIIVTPSADLPRTAKAIAFGLRLNGGAVCMSPRRLFATPSILAALKPLLLAELAAVPAVQLAPATATRLQSLLDEATTAGATILTATPNPCSLIPNPCLLDNAIPTMAITRSDIFAPVLSLIPAETMMHVPELYAQCPYALTASIFCGPKDLSRARALAHTLKAGTVLFNDLIAPTADPRLPFGGRAASGYGLTRGAEGLLEMTTVKTLILRKNSSTRHFIPTTEADTPLFAALIATVHGSGWRNRLNALATLIQTARSRKPVKPPNHLS